MSQQDYQEINEIWELVKKEFHNSGMSETAVNLWFGEIHVVSFEHNTVTLGIPSEYKFKTVNEKYMGRIKEILSELLGFEVGANLIFTGSAVTASEMRSKIVMPEEEGEEELPPIAMPDFNFQYTFENFIVGSTNKFAYAACVSVANHPAENYNPLFIYGNSGLGKTHLLCAVVNQMKKNNPKIRIMYTKSEDFINQMISCLANKTMEDFRNKYRECDALLIDDIQFIAGKVAMQEEFFHTFNTLFERKKQIIITSDRPPRDIKTLEERLKTRFEWGLLADIEPPDLELRIAIIKKKAEQVKITLPNDVLTFLAENLRSNIRQMEGAIKKLAALTFLSGRELNMELAHSCLNELLGGAEPVSITVDKIIHSICGRYNVTKEELTGPNRSKNIASARHIAIFLIREMTEMSYPNIGKLFNRDHSTIMSSIEIVKKNIAVNPESTVEINEIKKEVFG